MAYTPTVVPTDPGQIPQYLQIELTQLARALQSVQSFVLLDTLYAAPKKPRDGMIVVADGTTWNPGSSGGVYVYLSGAWHLLGLNPANIAYTNVANVFIKGQTVTPVVLTDGATISTDASLSNHFTVTLGGNRTLANPSNLTNGEILNWKIKQDGTGSRTLSYGTKFKFASGTAPVLSTAAGAIDYLSGHYFSDDDVLVCGFIKGLA